MTLYENAVPLAEAWQEFAMLEHRKAFAATPSGIEKFNNTAQSNPDVGFWSAVGRGIEASQKRNGLISEMQDSLLDALFNSDLIALGIRQRPSKSHYPVELDSGFFEFAKINWRQSTAQWEDKLYSDVRVYDPDTVAASTPAKPRKGSIEAIDRVIAELKSELPDFCDLPRKSACQKIRDKLGIAEISGNGLSDKNLAKRINVQCGQRGISN